MELTLTVGDAINAQGAVDSLLQETIPPTMAFKLARVRNALEPERKAFEEQRQALVKQYADPEDEEMKVADKNAAAFQGEIRGLLDSEIDVDVPVVSYDELEVALKKAKAHPKGNVWASILPVLTGTE